jgi:hypothetical protein
MSSSPQLRGNQTIKATSGRDKKKEEGENKTKEQDHSSSITRIAVPMAFLVLFLGILMPLGLNPFSRIVVASPTTTTIPALAQIIDQKSFNVLDVVPPPAVANATSVRQLILEFDYVAIEEQPTNSYSYFSGQE